MTVRRFRTVVVGHGGLANALAESARLIVGATLEVGSVDLGADETPESFGDRLLLAMPDDGTDVLLLADLQGGTPHNIALAVSARGSVHVIAGANLPVLLEAVTAAEPLTEALVERLVATGRGALSSLPLRAVVD